MIKRKDGEGKKNRTRLSIRTKLIFVFIFASVVMFAVNLILYSNINGTIRKIDDVYVTNVSLNELSETLAKVQSSMFEYLNTRTSDALEDYYRYGQTYKNLLEELNDVPTDNEMKLMEKNIRSMSEQYLELAEITVQGKRGRNIEKYKQSYETTTSIYKYISTHIYALNNEQFKNNSNNYGILLTSLQYLEVATTFVLFIVSAFNVIVLLVLTGRMTKPLVRLALAADEVAGGNFEVELVRTDSSDEIGIVANAFNKMVLNIKDYIVQIKERMEMESQMKENELMMKNHLKDAQLKYLQAQINPHFLFNTLNAGAQLAMMEGAEKTCLFVENMADFFRYNVKKINEDATLLEEVRLVDSYIYILNVRFSGDIHFQKEIEEEIPDIRVPSMILQPIVENAVNYGIRGLQREGYVRLTIRREEENVRISILDNGIGMEKEQIDRILEGEMKESKLTTDSNGIGLTNVIRRLQLYFGRKNIMEIISEGKDCGTEVIIKIPTSRNG